MTASDDQKLPELTSEDLLDLGFLDIGLWTTGKNEVEIDYKLDGENPEADALLLDEANALYAFVQDAHVKYIGKTARTLRKRFKGYRRPGPSQSTNRRNNENIRQALTNGEEIRVFVFNPPSKLRFGPFEISIAAGIEDALIAGFAPPWNRPDRGRPLSEEAEREQQEEPDVLASPTDSYIAPSNAHADRAGFRIKLGQAYYKQGIINPGSEASILLGAENEPIRILFGDGTEPLISRINRTANRNGSVRVFYKGHLIATWFQKHFNLGDTVQANVIDRNTIELLPKT